MRPLSQDAAETAGFQWPEPLIIDILVEQYIGLLESAAILRVARLHARLLKYLFEDDIRQAGAARKILMAECARHGIGAEQVAIIDRRAFWEITGLIHSRYRPSTASTSRIDDGLHAAVCRLGLISLAA